MSTVTIPPVLTSPRDDAMHLYRAFKGFGCDTEAIINILAHRDATQRALIQQEYRAMYSQELSKRLSSELSNNVKKAVSLWMHDPAARDATIVRQALSGDIVDLKAATEDIEYQASGDLKKLLLAYIRTPRYEGPEVDKLMVEKDAKALFKAGEKKLGTDENTFIQIFSGRSRAQLAAIDSAYHNFYGNSLQKAVKKETSGNFEFALLTILRCAHNPGKFFAKVLHKAMKGLGTNDTTLIRIVVTRAEIDMQYIKAEYQKKYGKTLNDAVHSETSGHYRAFLLALLGPSH
ncbi:hypothetical protein ACB094_03G089900 [Castanea mollissima]